MLFVTYDPENELSIDKQQQNKHGPKFCNHKDGAHVCILQWLCVQITSETGADFTNTLRSSLKQKSIAIWKISTQSSDQFSEGFGL